MDVIDAMTATAKAKGMDTAIGKRKDGVWVIAMSPDEKDVIGTLQAAILTIANKEMPIIDVQNEDEE